MTNVRKSGEYGGSDIGMIAMVHDNRLFPMIEFAGRAIVIQKIYAMIYVPKFTPPLCNLSDTCYSKASITLSNLSILLAEYCPYCSQQCSITDFIVKASACWS
ncbi:unnamed protein product, partial [Rotaria magnacalcarata]